MNREPTIDDAALRADERSARSPLERSELAMIAGFWALLALVTIANRLFDPRGQGPQLNFSSAPVVLPIVASILWTAVTPALFALSDRVDADRVGRFARVAILLAAAITATLIVTVGVDIAATSIINNHPSSQFATGAEIRRRSGGPPLGFRLVNNGIIALGVVAAGLARSYSLRYRAREEQATRLQAQLAEARLHALRQQLDPHFLFNTLNAVSALVERDPRGVRRMISRLSELLRYNIEGSAEQEVPLRQELQWIGRYLEVMEVRFQGRLGVRTSASDAALDALVPNLILQPLVENAIKHGVGRALGPGTIAIEADVTEGQTILRVRDSGAGEGEATSDPHESDTPSDRHPRATGGSSSRHPREGGDPFAGPNLDPRFRGDDAAEDAKRGAIRAAEGSGVGLRNTVARLEQLYGDAQSFELRRTEDGGTVAEVRLPYHTRSDLHVAGVPVAR
jgi:signal transduction histidine kinase